MYESSTFFYFLKSITKATKARNTFYYKALEMLIYAKCFNIAFFFRNSLKMLLMIQLKVNMSLVNLTTNEKIQLYLIIFFI